MTDSANTQLLELLETAGDPDRAVLEFTLAALTRSDPELAHMVRICGLPRRLNPVIVDALAATQPDAPAGSTLLDRIAELSFVKRRSDGDLVYHDTVRDLLVADWQHDENAAELSRLTGALVAYYEERHAELAELERSLLRVSGVVRRISADRHVQLTHALESRLLAPLIEAVYHASLVSGEWAYGIFAEYVESYEATGRIGVCRALVSALRERLSLLDSDEAANRLLWLRYWDGRLLRGAGDAVGAEKVLSEIEPGDDTRLRMWTLGDLGTSLYDQDRYREARDIYEKELEIARTTLADPWNLTVSYIRLGDLAWQADELLESVEYYELAIHAAAHIAPGRNEEAECRASLNLAGALAQLGRFQDSFAAAFHALEIARVNLPQERQVQQVTADRFMFVLAPWEPRLVSTLYDESRVVLPPQDEATRASRTLGRLAALREARRALTDAEIAEFGKPPDPDAAGADMTGRYLVELGLHADARGDYGRAVELYTAVLEDPAVTPWNRAASRTFRGTAQRALGRLEEAEADLRDAPELWVEMGSDVMGTVARADLALVLVRQGRLDEAEALIEECEVAGETLTGALASSFHEASGELHRARGRLEDAEAALRRNFEALAGTERLEAGAAATSVANVAASRSDWDTAVEWAERATDIWRRVAAAASYRQSPEEKDADRLNADAIRILSSPDGELTAARDLLLSATERVPWNMWYAINLGYVAGSLGDWGDAADAIERACGSAPLQIDALTQLLADFRFRQAGVLLDRGEAANAAAACRSILDFAGPGLGSRWFALLAQRAGDAELQLGRVEAAAAEYGEAVAASGDFPEARGGALARLAVVKAARDDTAAANELLHRAVDAYAEAGHGGVAWWSVTADVAAVAPKPEGPLEEALQRVFRELVEGGRVQTYRSEIEVPVPPDWNVVESFTFTAPEGGASLVVSGQPVESTMTLDEYAEQQQEGLEETIDSLDEVIVERLELPGGREGVLHQFTWLTEDDIAISSFQAYFLADGRAYTATGTTLADTEELQRQLIQLVRGLGLREPRNVVR